MKKLIYFFTFLLLLVSATALCPEVQTDCVTQFEAEPNFDNFKTLEPQNQLSFLSNTYDPKFATEFFSKPENVELAHQKNPGLNDKYFGGEGNSLTSKNNIVANIDSAAKYFKLNYNKEFTLDGLTVKADFSFNKDGGTFSHTGKVLHLEDYKDDEEVTGIEISDKGYIINRKEQKINLQGDEEIDIKFNGQEFVFTTPGVDGEPFKVKLNDDKEVGVVFLRESVQVTGDVSGLFGKTFFKNFVNEPLTLNKNGNFDCKYCEIEAPDIFVHGQANRIGQVVSAWAHGSSRYDGDSVVVDRISGFGAKIRQSKSQGETATISLKTISDVPLGEEKGPIPRPPKKINYRELAKLKPAKGDLKGDFRATIERDASGLNVKINAKGKGNIDFFGDSESPQKIGPSFIGTTGKSEFEFERKGGVDVAQVRGKAIYKDKAYISSNEKDGSSILIVRVDGDDQDYVKAGCFSCTDGSAIDFSKKIVFGKKNEGFDKLFSEVKDSVIKTPIIVKNGLTTFGSDFTNLGKIAQENVDAVALLGKNLIIDLPGPKGDKQTLDLFENDGVLKINIDDEAVDFGVVDSVGGKVVVTSDRNVQNLNDLLELAESGDFGQVKDLQFDTDPEFEKYVQDKLGIEIKSLKNSRYADAVGRFIRFDEESESEYAIKLVNGRCASEADCNRINSARRKGERLGFIYTAARLNHLKAEKELIEAQLQAYPKKDKVSGRLAIINKEISDIRIDREAIQSKAIETDNNLAGEIAIKRYNLAVGLAEIEAKLKALEGRKIKADNERPSGSIRDGTKITQEDIDGKRAGINFEIGELRKLQGELENQQTDLDEQTTTISQKHVKLNPLIAARLAARSGSPDAVLEIAENEGLSEEEKNLISVIAHANRGDLAKTSKFSAKLKTVEAKREAEILQLNVANRIVANQISAERNIRKVAEKAVLEERRDYSGAWGKAKFAFYLLFEEVPDQAVSLMAAAAVDDVSLDDLDSKSFQDLVLDEKTENVQKIDKTIIESAKILKLLKQAQKNGESLESALAKLPNQDRALVKSLKIQAQGRSLTKEEQAEVALGLLQLNKLANNNDDFEISDQLEQFAVTYSDTEIGKRVADRAKEFEGVSGTVEGFVYSKSGARIVGQIVADPLNLLGAASVAGGAKFLSKTKDVIKVIPKVERVLSTIKPVTDFGKGIGKTLAKPIVTLSKPIIAIPKYAIGKPLEFAQRALGTTGKFLDDAVKVSAGKVDEAQSAFRALEKSDDVVKIQQAQRAVSQSKRSLEAAQEAQRGFQVAREGSKGFFRKGLSRAFSSAHRSDLNKLTVASREYQSLLRQPGVRQAIRSGNTPIEVFRVGENVKTLSRAAERTSLVGRYERFLRKTLGVADDVSDVSKIREGVVSVKVANQLSKEIEDFYKAGGIVDLNKRLHVPAGNIEAQRAKDAISKILRESGLDPIDLEKTFAASFEKGGENFIESYQRAERVAADARADLKQPLHEVLPSVTGKSVATPPRSSNVASLASGPIPPRSGFPKQKNFVTPKSQAPIGTPALTPAEKSVRVEELRTLGDLNRKFSLNQVNNDELVELIRLQEKYSGNPNLKTYEEIAQDIIPTQDDVNLLKGLNKQNLEGTLGPKGQERLSNLRNKFDGDPEFDELVRLTNKPQPTQTDLNGIVRAEKDLQKRLADQSKQLDELADSIAGSNTGRFPKIDDGAPLHEPIGITDDAIKQGREPSNLPGLRNVDEPLAVVDDVSDLPGLRNVDEPLAVVDDLPVPVADEPIPLTQRKVLDDAVRVADDFPIPVADEPIPLTQRKVLDDAVRVADDLPIPVADEAIDVSKSVDEPLVAVDDLPVQDDLARVADESLDEAVSAAEKLELPLLPPPPVRDIVVFDIQRYTTLKSQELSRTIDSFEELFVIENRLKSNIGVERFRDLEFSVERAYLANDDFLQIERAIGTRDAKGLELSHRYASNPGLEEIASRTGRLNEEDITKLRTISDKFKARRIDSIDEVTSVRENIFDSLDSTKKIKTGKLDEIGDVAKLSDEPSAGIDDIGELEKSILDGEVIKPALLDENPAAAVAFDGTPLESKIDDLYNKDLSEGARSFLEQNGFTGRVQSIEHPSSLSKENFKRGVEIFSGEDTARVVDELGLLSPSKFEDVNGRWHVLKLGKDEGIGVIRFGDTVRRHKASENLLRKLFGLDDVVPVTKTYELGGVRIVSSPVLDSYQSLSKGNIRENLLRFAVENRLSTNQLQQLGKELDFHTTYNLLVDAADFEPGVTLVNGRYSIARIDDEFALSSFKLSDKKRYALPHESLPAYGGNDQIFGNVRRSDFYVDGVFSESVFHNRFSEHIANVREVARDSSKLKIELADAGYGFFERRKIIAKIQENAKNLESKLKSLIEADGDAILLEIGELVSEEKFMSEVFPILNPDSKNVAGKVLEQIGLEKLRRTKAISGLETSLTLPASNTVTGRKFVSRGPKDVVLTPDNLRSASKELIRDRKAVNLHVVSETGEVRVLDPDVLQFDTFKEGDLLHAGVIDGNGKLVSGGVSRMFTNGKLSSEVVQPSIIEKFLNPAIKEYNTKYFPKVVDEVGGLNKLSNIGVGKDDIVTIVLKPSSGADRKIVGRVVSESDQAVKLSTKDGIRVIPKSQIDPRISNKLVVESKLALLSDTIPARLSTVKKIKTLEKTLEKGDILVIDGKLNVYDYSRKFLIGPKQRKLFQYNPVDGFVGKKRLFLQEDEVRVFISKSKEDAVSLEKLLESDASRTGHNYFENENLDRLFVSGDGVGSTAKVDVPAGIVDEPKIVINDDVVKIDDLNCRSCAIGGAAASLPLPLVDCGCKGVSKVLAVENFQESKVVLPHLNSLLSKTDPSLPVINNLENIKATLQNGDVLVVEGVPHFISIERGRLSKLFRKQTFINSVDSVSGIVEKKLLVLTNDDLLKVAGKIPVESLENLVYFRQSSGTGRKILDVVNPLNEIDKLAEVIPIKGKHKFIETENIRPKDLERIISGEALQDASFVKAASLEVPKNLPQRGKIIRKAKPRGANIERARRQALEPGLQEINLEILTEKAANFLENNGKLKFNGRVIRPESGASKGTADFFLEYQREISLLNSKNHLEKTLLEELAILQASPWQAIDDQWYFLKAGRNKEFYPFATSLDDTVRRHKAAENSLRKLYDLPDNPETILIPLQNGPKSEKPLTIVASPAIDGYQSLSKSRVSDKLNEYIVANNLGSSTSLDDLNKILLKAETPDEAARLIDDAGLKEVADLRKQVDRYAVFNVGTNSVDVELGAAKINGKHKILSIDNEATFAGYKVGDQNYLLVHDLGRQKGLIGPNWRPAGNDQIFGAVKRSDFFVDGKFSEKLFKARFQEHIDDFNRLRNSPEFRRSLTEFDSAGTESEKLFRQSSSYTPAEADDIVRQTLEIDLEKGLKQLIDTDGRAILDTNGELLSREAYIAKYGKKAEIKEIPSKIQKKEIAPPTQNERIAEGSICSCGPGAVVGRALAGGACTCPIPRTQGTIASEQVGTGLIRQELDQIPELEQLIKTFDEGEVLVIDGKLNYVTYERGGLFRWPPLEKHQFLNRVDDAGNIEKSLLVATDEVKSASDVTNLPRSATSVESLEDLVSSTSRAASRTGKKIDVKNAKVELEKIVSELPEPLPRRVTVREPLPRRPTKFSHPNTIDEALDKVDEINNAFKNAKTPEERFNLISELRRANAELGLLERNVNPSVLDELATEAVSRGGLQELLDSHRTLSENTRKITGDLSKGNIDEIVFGYRESISSDGLLLHTEDANLYREAISREDGLLDFVDELDNIYPDTVQKVFVGSDGLEYTKLAYDTGKSNPNSVAHYISRKRLATQEEWSHILDVAKNPSKYPDDLNRLELIEGSVGGNIEELQAIGSGKIKLYEDVNEAVRVAANDFFLESKVFEDSFSREFNKLMLDNNNRKKVIELVSDFSSSSNLRQPVVIIDFAGRAHVQPFTLREGVSWVAKNWDQLTPAQKTLLGNDVSLFRNAKIDLHLGVGSSKRPVNFLRYNGVNLKGVVGDLKVNRIRVGSTNPHRIDSVESFRTFEISDEALAEGRLEFLPTHPDEQAAALKRKLVISDQVKVRKSLQDQSIRKKIISGSREATQT